MKLDMNGINNRHGNKKEKKKRIKLATMIMGKK